MKPLPEDAGGMPRVAHIMHPLIIKKRLITGRITGADFTIRSHWSVRNINTNTHA